MRHSTWILLLFWLGLASLTPSPAFAQLTELETEDLRIIYIDPLQAYLVPHAARCFENSMEFQKATFHYAPWEKVTVLLTDLTDYGTASATAMPRNRVSINIAPLSFAYETMAPNERLITIMNHELIHVTSMDQTAKSDRFFRHLFGGKVLPTADHPETILYMYLTAPRVAVPRWYQEGTAVFAETWMAGGVGRAQGSWDEMVFRSMVRDDSHFYDPLGLVSEGVKVDFQVGVNSYLYGTRFISYLAYRFSPEKVVEWISRTDDTKAYYAFQFRKVFGMKLKRAWSDWIEWEHEFQARNLQEIRQYPTTDYHDLSDRALGAVSRAYVDTDTQKIYAAFNYPGTVSHIGAISMVDGSVERLTDVKGPMMYTVTSLAYDPAAKMLYYTTDNLGHRDVRSLDPATKKVRLLMKDVRIGELVFDGTDRALWGLRQENGISTLVRIPYPYHEWRQVYSWPYGQVVYDMDVSPDGRRISASVGEVTGRHRLQILDVSDLEQGQAQPIRSVDFGTTIPSNGVFSQDGRYIFGSSYWTGVSNIFRYEIDADQFEPALTNAETGFFRPLPTRDDELVVFRYTGEGFVPATLQATPLEDVAATTFLGPRIIAKHPELRDWAVGSPADIDLESRITSKKEYHSWKNIWLESIYPVIEGYNYVAVEDGADGDPRTVSEDYYAFGLSANFSDPIYLNRLSLTATYTPDKSLPSDERLHARIKFNHTSWWLEGKYNAADFYDLFGPTKSSRKGYMVGGGYKKSLIWDAPRSLDLTVDASYHGDLVTLPSFQNVRAPYDKLFTANASLAYSNLKSSLGAVDYEKGQQWELYVGSNVVSGDFIPFVLGTYDVGFELPLPHSSIFLRSAAGIAFGQEEDPFANFYFGGFGNNWVDHGSIQRYRAWYSFPGVELNAIGGDTFVKSMLEWNLPPLRFSKLGSPGFFITWARTSLFAAGIETNPDESVLRERYGSLGVQVDFRLNLMSSLDMTLSVGYAQAYQSGVDAQDEFMASLKILR